MIFRKSKKCPDCESSFDSKKQGGAHHSNLRYKAWSWMFKQWSIFNLGGYHHNKSQINHFTFSSRFEQ